MGAKPRRVALPAAPRAPFTIGGSTIAPGTKALVEIPVARLPIGTWLALPIEVVHGRLPGPTIWLSAAIHGDELNGIPIVRRTLRKLDPDIMRGTVIAVPVVNPFGLIIESRYLPDRRDLNRSFPGSNRGSMASQLAHLFMTEVVNRCELGIDYHTGSGGRANLPQIRCDLDDKPTRAVARKFAAPVIAHSKLRDGSLRAAACEMGIRVLIYEAGEALRFDNESIDLGIAGTLRVMHHIGMIPSAPRSNVHSHLVQKSRWLRASRAGLLEMAVSPGAHVKKGDIIARLYSTIDRKDLIVRAPQDGIVIGQQSAGLVHRGEAIAHIASR